MPSNHRELAEAADRFLDELKFLPEERRAWWVAYILEGLEADHGVAGLRPVVDALTDRFTRGGW